MLAKKVIETHAAPGSLGAELERLNEHFLYPEALETVRRAQKELPELAA
ncbi:MAG: hypothetical protein Q7U91_10795 [Sideroxyarcus sp.]|nr:hypothetical protein [Sideroxyarcus sp.]